MPVNTELHQSGAPAVHASETAAALYDLRRLLLLCEIRPDETPEQAVRRFDSLFALSIRAGSSLTEALKALEKGRVSDRDEFDRIRGEMLALMQEAKLALCLPDGATEVPEADAWIRRARAAAEKIPSLIGTLEEMRD